MRRIRSANATLGLLCLLCFPAQPAFALATVHHLYNASRQCVRTVVAPLKGAFVEGPKRVKEAYISEVWEQEKPKNQGLLRNKLFGIWRAPGEETKAILDGLDQSATSIISASKELISIFFGD